MKIPDNIAERYVTAVEREAERTRRYEKLLKAQMYGTQDEINAAQNLVDEIEGEGDL